jgi:hypothetical protein
VERLHAQWGRLRGRLVLSAGEVGEYVSELGSALGVAAPREPLVSGGDFRAWNRQVVQRASMLAEAVKRPCSRCKRHAPTTCSACVQDVRLEQRLQIEKVRADARYFDGLQRSRDRGAGPARTPLGPLPTGVPEGPRRASSATGPMDAAGGAAPSAKPAEAGARRLTEIPDSWFDEKNWVAGVWKPGTPAGWGRGPPPPETAKRSIWGGSTPRSGGGVGQRLLAFHGERPEGRHADR